MVSFIDVHCHITGEDYDSVGGVEQIIQNAKNEGVDCLICSGFDLASSEESKRLAEQYDNVYFCAGFHPSELGKMQGNDLEKIAQLCGHDKCVAVGEIGLDYHFEDNPAPTLQRETFIKQLQIADTLGLPVVIHSRDAAQETYEILKAHQHLLKHGGLLHCYSYSVEMLKEFAKLGLCFSFGGASTFKNAAKAQECIRQIPAPLLLSETDCPYLTPVPFRGQFPNQPKNVKYVVENMAILRGENVEELKKQILDNARKLFFKLKI